MLQKKIHTILPNKIFIKDRQLISTHILGEVYRGVEVGSGGEGGAALEQPGALQPDLRHLRD